MMPGKSAEIQALEPANRPIRRGAQIQKPHCIDLVVDLVSGRLPS
jgi:hypothetical protein